MSIHNILVADDEESMRWVLSKALKKKGFSVDLAGDGDEALQADPCQRLRPGDPGHQDAGPSPAWNCSTGSGS